MLARDVWIYWIYFMDLACITFATTCLVFMLTKLLSEDSIRSADQIHLVLMKTTLFIKVDIWCSYQSVVLGDQYVKIYLWRITPYAKWKSRKSVKIFDQAVCLMMVSILKSNLNPHQKNILISSKVLNPKIV